MESGKYFPNHNYTFLIGASGIARVVELLQQYIQVRPGCIRDVKVSLNMLRSMPVYERGGKSIESLFVSYKGAYPRYDLQIIRSEFNAIENILKTRREKAILSTYYIHMRYTSQIF